LNTVFSPTTATTAAAATTTAITTATATRMSFFMCQQGLLYHIGSAAVLIDGINILNTNGSFH
jgi:hypothetical protein